MNIFMANPILTVGILAWLAAQVIKTVLHAIKTDFAVPPKQEVATFY